MWKKKERNRVPGQTHGMNEIQCGRPSTTTDEHRASGIGNGDATGYQGKRADSQDLCENTPSQITSQIIKRRRWCWSGKPRNDSSSTYTRNKSTRWLLIASARQKHSLTSPRRRIKSNRTLSSFRIPSEVLQIRLPKRVVLWGGAKKQRPIQSCE